MPHTGRSSRRSTDALRRAVRARTQRQSCPVVEAGYPLATVELGLGRLIAERALPKTICRANPAGLCGAPLPVLVPSLPVADQPSVIVGVDASPESEAALEWAVRLAGPLGWRVVAVHAIGLLEGGGYRPRTDAVGLVEGVCRRLGGVADVPVEEIVEAGHPAETIVRVAERERGALIVVGSRGLGEAPRLLGSTSEGVLAHARAPVLIVPKAGSSGASSS